LPGEIQRLGLFTQAFGDDAMLRQRAIRLLRRIAVRMAFHRLTGRPNYSFESIAHAGKTSVGRSNPWMSRKQDTNDLRSWHLKLIRTGVFSSPAESRSIALRRPCLL